MNALQPHRDPSPTPPRQPRVRSRSRQSQSPHRVLVTEVTMKLTVNFVLATVAVSTLFRLIPYNLKQQSDLQQIQGEVEEVATKVAQLEEDFDRHFDPQQALNVMQEQNIRFNPKERQIVWVKPNIQKAETSTVNNTQQANFPTQAPD